MWVVLCRVRKYSTTSTVDLCSQILISNSTNCWRRLRWRERPVPPGRSLARVSLQGYTQDPPDLLTDSPTWPGPQSHHRGQRTPSWELYSTLRLTSNSPHLSTWAMKVPSLSLLLSPPTVWDQAQDTRPSSHLRLTRLPSYLTDWSNNYGIFWKSLTSLQLAPDIFHI